MWGASDHPTPHLFLKEEIETGDCFPPGYTGGKPRDLDWNAGLLGSAKHDIAALRSHKGGKCPNPHAAFRPMPSVISLMTGLPDLYTAQPSSELLPKSSFAWKRVVTLGKSTTIHRTQGTLGSWIPTKEMNT